MLQAHKPWHTTAFSSTIHHWLFLMFKCTSLLKHVSCIKDSGDYFLIFYFKETKRSWNEFQNKNKVGYGSRVFCVVGHCSVLSCHTPGSELGLHIREGCFVPFSPKLSQTSWLLLVQALSPHSSLLGWPQSPALCAFPKQRQVDCNKERWQSKELQGLHGLSWG